MVHWGARGGGGGRGRRGPQSKQSVPYMHDVPYSEPGPPSSQSPSKAYIGIPMHSFVQRVEDAPGGKGEGGGRS